MPQHDQRQVKIGKPFVYIEISLAAGDGEKPVDPPRKQHFQLAAFKLQIEIVEFQQRHIAVLDAGFRQQVADHTAEHHVGGVQQNADVVAAAGDERPRRIVRNIAELLNGLLDLSAGVGAQPDIVLRIPVQDGVNGGAGDSRSLRNHPHRNFPLPRNHRTPVSISRDIKNSVFLRSKVTQCEQRQENITRYLSLIIPNFHRVVNAQSKKIRIFRPPFRRRQAPARDKGGEKPAGKQAQTVLPAGRRPDTE